MPYILKCVCVGVCGVCLFSLSILSTMFIISSAYFSAEYNSIEICFRRHLLNQTSHDCREQMEHEIRAITKKKKKTRSKKTAVLIHT